MSTSERWFGYGGEIDYALYLTGFFSIVFKYGVVGVILLSLSFIALAMRGRTNFTSCACVIYLGLLFVCKLTDIYSLVFYFSLIVVGVLNGCNTRRRRRMTQSVKLPYYS